jgi:hypothetical protein
MVIEDQKAAKIRELLKQLSAADTFQSVAITRQIRDIATGTAEQEQRTAPGNPVATNPTQIK